MRRRRASASSSGARGAVRERSEDEDASMSSDASWEEMEFGTVVDGSRDEDEGDDDEDGSAAAAAARAGGWAPVRPVVVTEWQEAVTFLEHLTEGNLVDYYVGIGMSREEATARYEDEMAWDAYDDGLATARDIERIRPERLVEMDVDDLQRFARYDEMLEVSDRTDPPFKLVALTLAALRLSELDAEARAATASGDGEVQSMLARSEAEWVVQHVGEMRFLSGDLRTTAQTAIVERDFTDVDSQLTTLHDEVTEATLCLRAVIAMATGGENGELARTSDLAINDTARQDLLEYERAVQNNEDNHRFDYEEFCALVQSYAERLQGTPFIQSIVENRRIDGERGIHRTIQSAGKGLIVAFEDELENATFFLFVLNVWGVAMFEHFDSDSETDSDSDEEHLLDDMEDAAAIHGTFHQDELWQKEDAFWNCSPYVRIDDELENKDTGTKKSFRNDRAGFTSPGWIPFGLTHQQGADSLFVTTSSDFAEPVRDGSKPKSRQPHMHLFASGMCGVSAWTTSSEETGAHFGIRGSTLERRYAQLRPEAEVFRVYSMAFDDETRTLAVCGTSPYYDVNHNVIVYRVEVSATDKMRDRANLTMREGDKDAFMDEFHAVDHYFRYDHNHDTHIDSPAWDFVELCRANIGNVAVDPYADRRGAAAYDPMQPDIAIEADQANCVRFGRLVVDEGQSRKLRLLLSSNDGYVYVCRLEENGEQHRTKSYRLVKDFVIHHRDAVNCAVPSPCGRMIASGCDSHEVHVMKFSTFASEVREFDKERGMLPMTNCRSTVGGDLFKLVIPLTNGALAPVRGARIGSVQYLAWSPDGRYLAATNDTECTVTVWLFKDTYPTCEPSARTSSQSAPSAHRYRMEGVVRIAFIFGHQLPCLPIRFGVANPSLMIWAERGGRLHMFDVRQAEEHYEDVYQVHESLRAREPTRLDELKDFVIDFNRCANVDMGYDSEYNRTTIPPENERWENLTFEQRCSLTTMNEESIGQHSLGKYFAVQTFRRVGRMSVHKRNDEFITGLSVVPCANGPSMNDIVFFSSRQNVKAFKVPAGLNSDLMNFNEIPYAAQRAVIAFLLCVKASRRNTAPGATCLADLPSELIHDIIVKLASPFYKWSNLDAAFYKSKEEASYRKTRRRR